MTDLATFGTLVFDTMGELFHKGETRFDPDSAEGIELRKAALGAMNAKGDDAVTVSGRELANTVLAHLMGLASFVEVEQARKVYEQARIKA